jgi:hypothetical protein
LISEYFDAAWTVFAQNGTRPHRNASNVRVPLRMTTMGEFWVETKLKFWRDHSRLGGCPFELRKASSSSV